MPNRISLCMIVKNEADDLPVCIGSAADLVDDIVVVDTGSTDRTKEVAAGLGARVFDFTWVDDFAAARNESIKHATGDWIFWLDGDELLDEDNRRKLRTLKAGLKNEIVAYMMTQWSLPNAVTGATMSVEQARMYPNHPQVRWRYRVHEQITPAVEMLGGSLLHTDISIKHVGYQDPDLRRRKNERNLRLLKLGYSESPNDPIILFQLGWAYLDLGKQTEAITYLNQSLQYSPPSLSSSRKAYALLLNAYYGLGQKQQALSICRQGRMRYPDDAELLFAEGRLLAEAGDLRGGEACLTRLLGMGLGQSMNGVDAGLFGYLARHHLAEIYAQAGRMPEAERLWRQVTQERPDYINAWLGLVELWRVQNVQGDLAQAEAVAHQLRNNPHKMVDAMLLLALVYRARKQFAAARQLLEETIGRAPQALMLRQLLSFVIMEEGRDWPAFERVLRDVLRLAPNDAQARHNLQVLLRQQGRPLEN